MMTAVAILKDAETSGLVAEIAKGTWMRSPRSKMDRGHGDLDALPTSLVCCAFVAHAC